MGKIDLTRALRINTQTGELRGLKGAGFAWAKPANAPDPFGPGDWEIVSSMFPSAAGGLETVIEQDGRYYHVHTFLEDGSLNVMQGGQFEYLIVAGGGGGSQRTGPAGGGGGGQVRSGSFSLSAGVLPAVVGAGGLGGIESEARDATAGQNSSFNGVVSLAGAAGSQAGGRHSGADGGASGSGNSGGEGAQLTIDGIRNAATRAGGGGGGDSAAGLTATGTTLAPSDITRPDGGAGTSSSIAGTPRSFGGGGGGGAAQYSLPGLGRDGGGDGGDSAQPGRNATPNSGSGGGGNGRGGDASGNGGSGIVILRYEISEADYNAGTS